MLRQRSCAHGLARCKTTAQRLSLLVLWFLLHASVGVVAISKVDLQKPDQDQINRFFPPDSMLGILGAHYHDRSGSGNKFSPWHEFTFEFDSPAREPYTPIFPNWNEHGEPQTENSSGLLPHLGQMKVMKTEAPSKIVGVQGGDGKDPKATLLQSGTFGRIFGLVTYSISKDSTSAEPQKPESALKHVVVLLHKGTTISDLFSSGYHQLESTEKGVSFFVPKRYEDVKKALLKLFRDADKNNKPLNPDIREALREAYVALHVTNQPGAKHCCVETHYVRVAFSEVSDFGEVHLHAHFIYCMERMSESLSKLFSKDTSKREEALDYATRMSLFVKAIAAVHDFHKAGYTHGDIKYANILVGFSARGTDKQTVEASMIEVVKVADFGTALPVDQMRSLRDGYTRGFADPRLHGMLGKGIQAGRGREGLEQLQKRLAATRVAKGEEIQILGKPMPVNSPIGCDAWSVGVALYCWAASVWSRSDFAARYCRFGDNTPDDRLNSWTWGSHPSPLVYNSAPPAKVTGKAASRIFKNGFQKWYVYRRLFRKFEGIAFSVWKEKGFTRNFPPPFDTYTSGDLWTECECRKKKTETAETHNERKKQRTFYCFMWALLRYALNHAPAQRDLEKLKNALEALQTGEPNLGVLVEAAPSGKSASSFAQTNSRPSSEDITTTTTEAEPNGELQQLIHASTDQSQTFNSNADAVIRDEEASSSTLVSEEPEGPSSASARAHYKVVHPHVQKGKYYKKMNKKNKAGEDFNAFLELQGFVRNNFDEKDAEKDEPLIDVPVTKQEEDRDRDQPSASVQGPETSGGLGSGILEL